MYEFNRYSTIQPLPVCRGMSRVVAMKKPSFTAKRPASAGRLC